MPDDTPRVVSTKQAAAMVGRSVRALETWRANNAGPPFLVHPDTGRFYGYLLADVVAWIEQMERRTR